jgi:hypothetical protein
MNGIIHGTVVELEHTSLRWVVPSLVQRERISASPDAAPVVVEYDTERRTVKYRQAGVDEDGNGYE